MAAVNGRDVVLTGIPRSGTTLACRLLGDCRDTVALFEPMDVSALRTDDPRGAAAQVGDFFRTARAGLLQHGCAPSKQRDGRVPDNPFADPESDGSRRLQVAPGVLQLDALPRDGFTLVIKHNAAFTALLPWLAPDHEPIAIVRHPLAVLASWQSVDLPVRDGHVPAGERLDPALQARLAVEPDRLARQLSVLDWGFSQFAKHLPRERILRYEDIVSSQGNALYAVAGVEPAIEAPNLASRNANPAWRASATHPGVLANSLVGRRGAWEAWYPDASIHALAECMSRAWERR